MLKQTYIPSNPQPASLISFTQRQQEIAGYFARNFASNPVSFIPGIDRRCQMFSYGIQEPELSPGATFAYYDSALKMLYPLQRLAEWKFGSVAACRSILDFASGFGRLTRFLVQETMPGTLSISDIQDDAVRFQQHTFGVGGFRSHIEPEQLFIDKKFDCIFVASLFTHLPEHRFHAWLRKLIGLLNANGMLVFSVHDASLLARHRAMSTSGFDFNPHVSEIGSLAASEYGSTHVSKEFVSAALAKASLGQGNFHLIPRGLWHHDLYIYTPDGSAGSSRPGIGILAPEAPICVEGGRVTVWFSETTPQNRVTDIRLSVSGTPRDPSVCFNGDGRFLPNGWQAPLYATFHDVPDDACKRDVYLNVSTDAGEVRRMPVFGTADG